MRWSVQVAARQVAMFPPAKKRWAIHRKLLAARSVKAHAGCRGKPVAVADQGCCIAHEAKFCIYASHVIDQTRELTEEINIKLNVLAEMQPLFGHQKACVVARYYKSRSRLMKRND